VFIYVDGMHKHGSEWLMGEGTVRGAGAGSVDGDVFTHQKCVFPEGWPKSNGIQENSEGPSRTRDALVHAHNTLVGLATANAIFFERAHARSFAH
jgi:hypothetical protein